MNRERRAPYIAQRIAQRNLFGRTVVTRFPFSPNLPLAISLKGLDSARAA